MPDFRLNLILFRLLFLAHHIRWHCHCNISLCESKIFVNGKGFSIHTETSDSIDVVVERFCTEQKIAPIECKKVYNHHLDHCFAGKLPEEVKDEPSTSTFDISTDKNSVESFKVDYSQKIGPLLTVHSQDFHHKLQAYLGETTEKTLNRFCHTLHLGLHTTECNQVKQAYLSLVHTDKYKIPLIPNNNNYHSPEETEEKLNIQYIAQENKETKQERESFLFRVIAMMRELYEGIGYLLCIYWKWITLLIICVYVMYE
mmetsp:Transcript_28437/g.28752  ORF Transcript_28437/g.28752 Transcript_28437/m.28752 type:complete len:257 (+) Transcript_28437:176-946(+)